jgi:hypothetical protein
MYNMTAFVDEIQKLAAEHTTQRCRTGSTPIRVHNLAEKDVYDKRTTKVAALGGAAASVAKPGLAKPLLTGALAIGAYEALRRANEDRKRGRMMRLQGMY